MKKGDARPDPLEFAAEILGMCETSPLSLQALLDDGATRVVDAGGDFKLFSELSYGVVRMKLRLQMIAEHYFTRLGRLPSRVRCLLLVAIYTVLFLDKIPEYAAVDRVVTFVKRRYGHTLARVANGGLRAVCREKDALKDFAWYVRRTGDQCKAVALYNALPLWIYNLWKTAYGDERAAMLAVRSSMRPAVGLRVNRMQPGWKNLAAQLEATGAARLGESALAFAPGERPNEDILPLTRFISEGKLSCQGAGSQCALEMLDPSAWPEPIWYACAGQGTKTCALLEQGKVVLAGSDIYLPRLRRIPGECMRLGLKTPPVFAASLLHPPLLMRPKTLLLDAPCSGLGVLAGRPDIRHRRTYEDVCRLLWLQERMLDASAEFLPSGGKLAFITCTFNPAENEQQIQGLCSRRSDMCIETEWHSPMGNTLMDGMYAALLVKA